MSESLENEIVHRRQGGESERHIARVLNVSRWYVSRVLKKQAEARDDQNDAPPASLGRPAIRRGSQLDEFQVHIERLLARYPRITATRVWEELKSLGYRGGYTILGQRVRELRKQPTKPLTVRFESAPGAQAQMDWSVYDLDFTQEGRRRVNLFSYILGYSRRQYLHFTDRQDYDTAIREHVQAFQYFGGLAATCLYDNMKVVVTRWEDDQPIYNTRFLAFATHYGYRPWACRPRRPETKGKVERPFYFVETSLLGGRTFRSLEHLNEVTRWWRSQVADVRIHGTMKRRPLDLFAEEQPHLLPLPARHYDTAQVVYRVVDGEGLIVYANNHYSVPWRLVGELLPVRVTETELLVYNLELREVARHPLWQGPTGKKTRDPAHAPPRDQAEQFAHLRARFAALGEIASRFLEGLLQKQRFGKHQAQQVLALLPAYHRTDLLAALERAVRYHAFSRAALERILTHQATPKPSWMSLSEREQDALRKLTDSDPIRPRPSSEYQHLLLPFQETDEPEADRPESETEDRLELPASDDAGGDSRSHPSTGRSAGPSGDAEDPAVGGPTG
jgi:transposase